MRVPTSEERGREMRTDAQVLKRMKRAADEQQPFLPRDDS